MATPIDLGKELYEEVFATIQKESALLQLAQSRLTTKNRDKVAFTYDLGDGAFHVAGQGEKEVSNDVVGTFDVVMGSMYKMLEFPDWQAEDADFVVERIMADLPGVLYRTLDRSAHGTDVIPSSPFTGFSDEIVYVNEDPESWLEAVDAISVDGFDANGMLLSNSARTILRSAITEGTTTNKLAVNPRDGFTGVADIPAFFRNLGTGTLSDGDLIGTIGDWTMSAVAYVGDVDLELHTPEEDYTLRKRNMAALYAGWRVGMGVANKKAFRKLVYRASV